MIVNEDELKTGELPINKIILGDALNVLKKFPDNSVDAVVTDPPYGLHFMNQKWDYDVPSVRLWKEVLRVLKPGGHLLSFFGTRTYHRGVVNIEDAGFEIRDMILWLYGEGFPKGQAIDKLIDKELGKFDERKVVNVRKRKLAKVNTPWKIEDGGWFDPNKADENGYRIIFDTEPATPEAKKWQGWNTALKPACEPIVLARKPLSEKNVARNVLKWGVGGLNIDACRIPLQDGEKVILHSKPAGSFHPSAMVKSFKDDHENTKGRYPANVILDEEAVKLLDKQSGKLGKSFGLKGKAGKPKFDGIYNDGKRYDNKYDVYGGYNDEGGASRFFYCAKAGRDERFAYCQDCDEVIPQKEWEKHKNHKLIFHTTVKPLKLIEYLVRLITPPNGIVLDPFFGTGTTGIACLKQGFRFIGIEIDPIYCKIAEHRLKPYVKQKTLLEF